MSYPIFTNQETLTSTKTALQYAAKLIKEIQFAYYAKELPQQLEHALKQIPNGLSTRPIKDLGNLILDFKNQTVYLEKNQEKVFSVSLQNQSAKSLAQAVLDKFKGLGENPSQDRILKQCDNESIFKIDAQTASDYATALDAVYTGFARIVSRFIGKFEISPIVFWAHGFDMAFVCFFTDDLTQGTGPHIMGGFSPGTAGIEEPYIYYYFWGKPVNGDAKYYPDNVEDVPTPEHSKWYTEGWKGFVISYNSAAKNEGNLPQFIEKTALQAIKTIKPMMLKS